MEEAQLSGCAQDRERLRVLINLAIAIGKRERLLQEVHDDNSDNPGGNHNMVPTAFSPSTSNTSSVRKLPRRNGHVECKY